MTTPPTHTLPESILQTMVQDAAIGIWMIDAEDVTRFVNPYMASMLGYTVAEMVGRPLRDFVDPPLRHDIGGRLYLRRQGIAETYEFSFCRADGSLLAVEVSATPLQDANRGYEGSLAFVKDVSRRWEIERRLAASELAYRSVFDKSQAIQLMVDPGNGNIFAANAAAQAFYGYSAEEFATLNIREINTLPMEEIKREMARVKDGTRSEMLFRHCLKSGEVRDVAVKSTSLNVDGHDLLYSTITDLGSHKLAERQLQMTQFTVDQAMNVIVWLDEAGLIRYANKRMGELVGVPAHELIGTAGWQFRVDMDFSGWQSFWNTVKRRAASGPTAYRAPVQNRNGHVVLIEAFAYYVEYEGDEFIITHASDVTDRVKAEGLLGLQRSILESVATGMSLSLVLDNLAREVERMAPEVICSVMLLDEEGRLRMGGGPSVPAQYAQAIDGQLARPGAGTCGEVASTGRSVETVDIATDPLWVDYKEFALSAGLRACWSTPIRARDGKILGTFAFYYTHPRGAEPFHRQIVDACTHLAGIAIEQRENEARIHSLAFYDAVTGLPNRSLLADRAQLALALSEREGYQTALLFADLDRFKLINDSLGHAVGDRFLQIMARRFQDSLRESDTLCRLGGDEFVVLLPDCDAEGAAVVAEKLIAAASQEVLMDGKSMRAGASVGISLYPEDAGDYDALMRSADTAMYQAKEAGRNGYRFFQREMNETLSARLVLEAALRYAIENNQLSLHYQPQLYMESRELYGAEALVRWLHPEWGMVSPAKFVPVAEACGLIDALGYWVLEEACRQMAAWNTSGLNLPAMSVNLSPQQFRQPDMKQRITDALRRHDLPSSQIRLEITEGLMMQDSDSTLRSLHELDRLGFKLAVDDFGTGYSSLSYLKRFPVSELKLDQSFVRDLGVDPDDRSLASAVISIGQSLNMTVVAEGVETEVQLAFLRRQGCDVVQGYLFGRPMPAEAFETWSRQVRAPAGKA